ncbi:MAG TPA: glycosyltransferase family 1 protein [Casimicrobiaceae bacterium]|nr:glycosyltransferase family 1 protein [Casimicrobiaceae bacterium]
MRILLATDAWDPQVNGVVMTLRNTIRGAEAAGHVVEVIGPDRFRNIPCPTYPEIRLALRPFPLFSRLVGEFAPDAVHIATEGPVGMAARKFCLREKLAFTTAYHTRFPEYVHARIRLPLWLTYDWLRRFHAPAEAVMVATPAVHADLERWGFDNLVTWTRGVDTELFRPGAPLANGWPRPVFMYVGRVAVEKNIEAFLALDLPGTKVVVGDGPQRAALQRRFPQAVFTGAKLGEELAAHFRSADVFVFPSRTDTFGLVLLEAMASGTPAAAYPVAGPIDVVAPGSSGILDDDLRAAALAALELNRDTVRRHALDFSWERATAQFLGNLHPNHARPGFA